MKYSYTMLLAKYLNRNKHIFAKNITYMYNRILGITITETVWEYTIKKVFLVVGPLRSGYPPSLELSGS